jgi:tetraacyldisaccharide 4'-kinase
MTVAERLTAAWYSPRLTLLTLAFAPLTPVFVAASALRRTLYRAGVLASQRLPVPVAVVGNLTVGGSGKTPLVAALARELAARGWHPGIVSRGYGRRDEQGDSAPLLVTDKTDPLRAGDEPALLARAGFPVAVAPDRAAAARALLVAHPRCNVILADDGLQHYGLARDVEIAVIDAARGFGNGWRLPAGPLREGPQRLRTVDAVVALVADDVVPLPGFVEMFRMTLVGELFRRVNAPEVVAPAETFAGPGVHAVAGIGNPQRFFTQLRASGIDAITHPFPDHHRFVAADLAFPNATAVLMTEKDAIKCTTFADERCWYLPVRAHIDPALVVRVEEKLRGYQAA